LSIIKYVGIRVLALAAVSVVFYYLWTSYLPAAFEHMSNSTAFWK